MHSTRPQMVVIDGQKTADDDLIAGVRRGDARYAEMFVDRVGSRAKAAVKRLLRRPTPDDADLTQLVLIELITTIDQYRQDCSLNTWVDRIAAHVVYKRLRRQRLEHRLFEGLGETAVEHVASHASAERGALTQSVLDRVRQLLAGIEEEKLSSWLMVDVYGMSLEEVAHAFETSVMAAQSRVSRARREVRERLNRTDELADLFQEWEVRP